MIEERSQTPPAEENVTDENTYSGKRLSGSSSSSQGEYRGKRLLLSEEEEALQENAAQLFDGETTQTPAAVERKPRGKWFERLQNTAMDLGDQMLDWRDDMSDRLSDMAADPENDSIAAKMIRHSEEIVSGIEDQERETEEITNAERSRRNERVRKVSERRASDEARPRFVFYTMENAPSKGSAGTPIQLDHPTLIDRNGNVVQKAAREKPEENAPAPTAAAPEQPEEAAAAAARTQEGETPASIPEPQPADEAASAEPETEPASTAKPEESEETPVPEPDLPWGTQEAQPAKEPAPAAKPAGPEEPAAAEQEVPRKAREPERSASAGLPSARERKQILGLSRTVQYWLFFAVLAIFAVAGLMMPFRSSASEVDGRALTEQPAATFSAMLDGSWFTQFDQWYNDTFPGRDRLAGLYDSLGTVFGFDNGGTTAESSADAGTSEEEAASEDTAGEETAGTSEALETDGDDTDSTETDDVVSTETDDTSAAADETDTESSDSGEVSI